MIRTVLGVLILAGIFGLIFAGSIHDLGWRDAAAMWAVVLALATAGIGAVWLITGGRR